MLRNVKEMLIRKVASSEVWMEPGKAKEPLQNKQFRSLRV